MEKSDLQTVTGFKFICLALYAFGGLLMEAIYFYLLEPIIYGASMSLQDYTVSQNIIHWIVTCITWGLVAYVLVRYAKLKYGFDLFEVSMKKVKVWQWICVFLFIMLISYIQFKDWNGLKPLIEYQKLGIAKFIFQYIYYAFETILFMLIIIFGQKACELWFSKEKFPYGAIGVAATWGAVHMLTKGSVWQGFLGAMAGFAFGVVYLLLNRDIKKVYPVLFIMFIL